MAVYTELSKPFLKELRGRLRPRPHHRRRPVFPKARSTPTTCSKTAKGKFLLRVDEVKSENELKREIDLLSFLRKHSFPCPHPLQDRMGRYYRDYQQPCVSLFKYQEGTDARARSG